MKPDAAVRMKSKRMNWRTKISGEEKRSNLRSRADQQVHPNTHRSEVGRGKKKRGEEARTNYRD